MFSDRDILLYRTYILHNSDYFHSYVDDIEEVLFRYIRNIV